MYICLVARRDCWNIPHRSLPCKFSGYYKIWWRHQLHRQYIRNTPKRTFHERPGVQVPFAAPWFQDPHVSRDLCIGCTDPGCESAAPWQQLVGASRGGLRKRRRILRRGIPENEVGELILPEEAPPVDYTLYDSEEDTDSTTSSASSTG